MIGIIAIDKLLGLILLGIEDLLITMDRATHGSLSSFLSFHSCAPIPTPHLPLITNAPMTTYTYSSIFWVSITRELHWGIELAKVSDVSFQYQMWSVQFLATLSLFSNQGFTMSQGAKFISEHKTFHFKSNTETVWPQTMSLSPGLMFSFHNCWSN